MTAQRRLRYTLLTVLALALVRPLIALWLRAMLPDVSVSPEINYAASILQSLLLFALPGWLLMRGTKAEGIGGRPQLDWLLLAVPAAVLAKLALSTLNILWCGLLSLEVPVIPAAKSLPVKALQMLALAIAPAVAEEIFFRGALLRNLQAQYGRRTALWLTTLFFALMHGSLGGLPGHLGVSLLLTLLAMHTGGILVPAAAHLVYNLLSFQPHKGALGALLLLAGLLVLLIRRAPTGGIRPRGREALLCGGILALLAVQYFV